MSCRVATFAKIHSTEDIDICQKFNDIIAWGNAAPDTHLRGSLVAHGASEGEKRIFVATPSWHRE